MYNSLILSQFNYCSKIWIFCCEKNQTNTEKIFTSNLKWTPHVFGRTTESWQKVSANFRNRKTGISYISYISNQISLKFMISIYTNEIFNQRYMLVYFTTLLRMSLPRVCDIFKETVERFSRRTFFQYL